MEDGDTHVEDPVDTIHHEMDNSSVRIVVTVFINLCICPVIGEQLILEKSLPTNSHNKFAVQGSDKGFSDSWSHSIGDFFTDHVVLYYTKELRHLLSDICHITGRRRKGKALKYHLKIIIIVDSYKTRH